MFRILGIVLMVLLSIVSVNAQEPMSNEKATIGALIGQYVQAGDDRNVDVFESILDSNFRIVVNGFRGQAGITIIDKSTYITLIESERIGGDTRTYTVEYIDVKENIATAKVVIEGTTVLFTSFYQFVKNEEGSWHLIGDMPYTEAK